MAKYIHPQFQAYSKIMSDLLVRHQQLRTEINAIVSLLSDNHIKFYSREDLTRFTRLAGPFDIVSLREVAEYLEFAYVHTGNQSKNYVVKFAGRSNKVLVAVSPKKHTGHTIEQCLVDLRKVLYRSYPKESSWFKVLGGLPGTDEIRGEVLHRKVEKMFANTCHSGCVDQVLKFITGGEVVASWITMHHRILQKQVKPSITIDDTDSPPTLELSPSITQNKSCFRITTYAPHQMEQDPSTRKCRVGQILKSFKRVKVQPLSRKRLRTLNPQSEIDLSPALEISPSTENSGNTPHRFRISSLRRKCKSTLSEFQQQ